MAKVKHTGERRKEKEGKVIDRIEAVAALTATLGESFRGPVIHGAKQEAQDPPRGSVRRQEINYDFYASVSAAELARLQGVQPIRKLGQIRTFSVPDPAQAEWLAQEVRRWRCEGLPPAVSH